MKTPLTKSDCVIQILQTATVIWRESRRFFRPFGLTEAQFNILNLLGQSPNGLCQRELSDRLVVDRSNITLLLDRMTAHGLLVRNDVPGDRRRYRVCLTEKGLSLWRRIHPHYEKALAHLVENLAAEDTKQLLKNLQEMELQAKTWKEELS
ncbi:MAG: MarR family transcriptional regulator [Verrucomicrobiae bacterium]|nr:MarR family transcriptional regulator [Verrucomicrobiae bacterium]